MGRLKAFSLLFYLSISGGIFFGCEIKVHNVLQFLTFPIKAQQGEINKWDRITYSVSNASFRIKYEAKLPIAIKSF